MTSAANHVGWNSESFRSPLKPAPSDFLARLVQSEAAQDKLERRGLVLAAEDMAFAPEQSGEMASWLLRFAEERRDSNDPQDEAAVLSAIRTGASLLRPEAADRLRVLLEPGHPIETSLAALKMLGRVFEAQPPREVDQHDALADSVHEIALSFLNRHVVTLSQNAAMAQLALYCLAAMASSRLNPVILTVLELEIPWFHRRTFRTLEGLREHWEGRPGAVASAPSSLLERALQSLALVEAR